MGEVRVPADALWRAQTQRAVENFPISGGRLEPAHIKALAQIKAAAAAVNGSLGVLPRDIAAAIAAAADDVAAGGARRPFPDRRVPDGLGHVVEHERERGHRDARLPAAGQAGAPERPRERVAVLQRRLPDVHPYRRRRGAAHDLFPALTTWRRLCLPRRTDFETVVKAGRTHLMDATPVTLGQEFSGYAAQVRYGVDRLGRPAPRL